MPRPATGNAHARGLRDEYRASPFADLTPSAVAALLARAHAPRALLRLETDRHCGVHDNKNGQMNDLVTIYVSWSS
jgi:hypothetical protein